MKTFASIFFFLLTLASFGQAASNADTLVRWGSKELSWSDFKGMPPRDQQRANYIAMAGTASSMNSGYSIIKDTLNFFSYSYFSKNQSWSMTTSDYSLNHERRHFDIAEIGARRIRQYFMSLNGSFIEDTIIQKRISQISDERLALQKIYDKETRHGINKAQQKLWDIKIKKMLDSLEAYKQSYGKIIIKG